MEKRDNGGKKDHRNNGDIKGNRYNGGYNEPPIKRGYIEHYEESWIEEYDAH